MNIGLASALNHSRSDGSAKFFTPDPVRMSDHEAAVHARNRAIVFTRIGLLPGDNTDLLEALGLIPTVRPPAEHELFQCPQCERLFASGQARSMHFRVHGGVRS